MVKKKEQVSIYLKQMESLIHKIIDDGKDQEFSAFELILLTIDTLLEEKKLNYMDRFKKAGNS